MSTRASAKLHTGATPLAPAPSLWGRVGTRVTTGESALLWLILGVGALLRLATLGSQSLWLDEGLSYWIADRPLAGLIDYLARYDTHPPLHYLILQGMIALGGAEWLLRLPSALAGIASIGLLYALGKELFDARTGLIAAFILAISPLHLWHGQEARMYALVAALTLAATLFAVRAVRTGRALDWASLVVCQAAALWTNTAAIWFTIALNATALALVALLWRRGRLWPWIASQALAVGLWLPWLPVFLQQLRVSGNNNTWIPPATVQQVALTLAAFVAQSDSRLVQVAALALLAAGLALGTPGLLREARRDRAHYALLTCWLAVPVGLAFIISQPYVTVPGLSLLVKPGASIFLTRNLIVATFPLYLLLARGLALAAGVRVPLGRWAVAGLLALLLVLDLGAYGVTLLRPGQEDWRGAARLLADKAEPTDLIVFVPPYIEAPFAYYFQRAGGASERRGYPHDDWAVHRQEQSYPTPGAVLTGYRRFWLVTSGDHDTIDLRLIDDLAGRGRALDEATTRGITMRLYAVNEGTR